MRVSAALIGASLFFVSFAASAQDGPSEEPAPAPSADPPPVIDPATLPAPAKRAPDADDATKQIDEAKEVQGPRAEGMRLGLDLSFARSSGESATRVNAGSPSLLPIGADVSWRTSPKVLLGFHGHFALASRDDCLGDTDCTGRAYGLGAHVEAAFSAGKTFVPYFRYGLGWEMVHQLGGYKNADAYRYRHAFDLLDVRFGGDFVLARGQAGRTTRLGPFVGMIAGINVDEVSSGRGNEADAGGGHLWFTIGARGTTDW